MQSAPGTYVCTSLGYLRSIHSKHLANDVKTQPGQQQCDITAHPFNAQYHTHWPQII